MRRQCAGGAHIGQETTSGTWPPEALVQYINFLELKAVQLALLFWILKLRGLHVLVELDNSTAVAYVNKQSGAHSILLCRLAKQILLLCRVEGIVLRAKHIPGSRNVLADSLSRGGQIQTTAWSLNPKVFLSLTRLWGTPTIYLFATRRNTRLPRYVSPIPDPGAVAVDVGVAVGGKCGDTLILHTLSYQQSFKRSVATNVGLR